MPTSDVSAPSIAEPPLQTAPGHPLLWLKQVGAVLEDRVFAERQQLPLWLPVGLGVGIAAWFALPDAGAWLSFLLAAGGVLAGALAAAPEARWSRALAIFALAAILGCSLVWWKAEHVAAPRIERNQVASFSAEVESLQPIPARETVRLVLKPLDRPDLPGRLRVNLPQKEATEALHAGATIRLRAWLMPPPPLAVPGGYDFARAAWFQGIGGTGKVLGSIEIVAKAKDRSWRAALAETRQSLAQHVRERLPGSEGAIAAALATGDQGAISEEDAEAMRRSGLAHLLSVSGLHITAVVGAVMFLALKLLALSRTLALRVRLTLVAALLGATAGISYTLLTGAEVPTVRACVAALLILLGIALGREAFTLRLVAVGAMVILLFWPEALPGPSFQMSFAAIVAIVAVHEHGRVKSLLSRRDEGLPARAMRMLLGLILTGLAVELALTPIALFHFHKAGFYGALANIVAIPLTTFIVMPAEALALLLDLADLGRPMWWVAGNALKLLLGIAHLTAAAPGAVTMVPTMPVLAFGLMIGGGIWLALWRSSWRYWGIAPIVAGAAWSLSTLPPDLIVTGDGKHLVLRTSSGDLAILRGRAGDYVRNMLSETSGSDAELLEVQDLSTAACSKDLCRVELPRNGRAWTLLATRTPHRVEIAALARACARADIVVSDRWLPRTCKPRWLKLDRAFLQKSGGVAITLGEPPRVRSVAERLGRHPWASLGGRVQSRAAPIAQRQ